jgi:acetyl esterase/lipase
LVAVSAHAAEPQRIPLWENGAPGTPATKLENEPVLFAYRAEPQNAARSAVVVCPGGGYVHLAMDHEGKQIAEWFNQFGVTAFVLQYRNNSSGHQHPVPMMDGQRAIRTVRARAAEWNIDPTRIGVMGFSAGVIWLAHSPRTSTMANPMQATRLIAPARGPIFSSSVTRSSR